MGEVYCKDCEHFNFALTPWYIAGDHNYCSAPQLGVIKDYVYGDRKVKIRVDDDRYPNKKDTNGCPYYVAYIPKPKGGSIMLKKWRKKFFSWPVFIFVDYCLIQILWASIILFYALK